MQRLRCASALARRGSRARYGDRDQVGAAVGLAQPEHGLIDDALIGSVADAAVDRPVDAGFLADLGDTGRLHVDRTETPLEDRPPDVLVVEQPFGGHQTPGGCPWRDRTGHVLGPVGVQLHPAGTKSEPTGSAGSRPPAIPTTMT